MRTLCLVLATAAVVTGQFLPSELPSTCASVSCLVGMSCREVFNPTSGIVSGQCLSNPLPSGNEGVCSVGEPLLLNSESGALTEAFCGRGLNRITCPSGWRCNIHPADRYAVCCQEDVNPAPSPVPTLPPLPRLTCASTLCMVGFSCREVYLPDGSVGPQCLSTVPDAGSLKVCTSGRSLLSQETVGANITVSYCGLGARRPCPSGYTCNVHPADAYAICCETAGKPGQCPKPAPGEVGICANTCSQDEDCTGEQKCCKNGCGATVCQDPAKPSPVNSCDTLNCRPDQTCEMLFPPCAPGSTTCDPVPTCVDKPEKAGECPAVVNDGNTVGICAFMCNGDSECTGDQKCCKNECGGTVCKDPVTSNPVRTCDTVRCVANQRCVMQQVECSRKPCPLVPMCVDIERDGVCPAPRFSIDILWRSRCQRDCESDNRCPGFQKCCNDYSGCGTRCEEPEPKHTCDDMTCRSGTYCVMKKVNCIRDPCFDVPECVDVASACSPSCREGYKCQLEWDRFTRNQRPTCVADPNNVVCSPKCTTGYECKLQEPWWCFFGCNPQPMCVRSRNCPVIPASQNPGCVRRDYCSESSPFACPGNRICCNTGCGRRCVRPLE